MYPPDPQRYLAAQVESRAAGDYRFNWPTYIGWTILTLGIYSLYGLYQLIDRRVEHARRRLRFSAALWHVLSARADAMGRRDQVQSGLDNLSSVHATLEGYERRNGRNPTILLVCRVIPFLALQGAARAMPGNADVPSGLETALGVFSLLALAGLAAIGTYTNHVLNADLRFIEQWEDALFQNATWVMERLDLPVRSPGPRHAPVRKRDTALYVLLTVVTVGLFAIAWRAMMMRDGNDHFDADDRVEDAILGAFHAGTPGPSA